MNFIEAMLVSRGFVNRLDLRIKFGISVPQASTDLQNFMRLYPQRMTYNLSTKRYERIVGATEAVTQQRSEK